MSRVAIVGAGQSGLLLAIALVKAGYDVSLFSDKASSEILNGWVTSSQAMFEGALQVERKHGLNFWETVAPKNSAIYFNSYKPNSTEKQISWRGFSNHSFQSVDQRIKLSAWLSTFQKLGGRFKHQAVNLDDLNKITLEYDLTIIATGKGKLGQLFGRDSEKSLYDKPVRIVACTYIKNYVPMCPRGVTVNILPGIGEFFSLPGISVHGECEMVLVQGIPGGPFDCWHSIKTPEAQLEQTIALSKQYVPEQYLRIKDAKLNDEKGVLQASITPEVRQPIKKLNNGKYVLGMGDAVVLNVPTGGQGANNASKCAQIYYERILENQDVDFDKNWMQATFDRFWCEVGKWSTEWTNILTEPPLPHVIKLLSTAEKDRTVANALSNIFDQPQSAFPWIYHGDTTNQYIEGLLKARGVMDNKTNLLKKNKQYLAAFKSSPLMRLINSDQMQRPAYRETLLDGIQVFSNFFQKTVMLRRVFTEAPRFKEIAQTHLDEEYGHSELLKKDRHYKEAMWDPILDATAGWFCWKMLELDNFEKTFLVHLVLESSANLFFHEADKVMKAYSTTNYFETHADLDEEHEAMGLELLEDLSDSEIARLKTLQKQGWEMLFTVCNRVAELTLKNSSATNVEVEQEVALA